MERLFLGILDEIEYKSLLRGREVYVTLERKEKNIEANCIFYFCNGNGSWIPIFLISVFVILKV